MSSATETKDTPTDARFRKKTFAVWILVVATLLILYFVNRDWFDIEFLQEFVSEHKLVVVAVYLLILSLLGLTFIPSTPFAIAGVLMFSPAEAYLINLLGIITSSTIVFHFARFVGLNHAFEAKYPSQVKKVREALRRKELPIIAGWSFFPAVPTDLIIYVASTLNIPLWKCLLGVLIGEGTLNAFYIFSVGFAL